MTSGPAAAFRAGGRFAVVRLVFVVVPIFVVVGFVVRHVSLQRLAIGLVGREQIPAFARAGRHCALFSGEN